MSPTKKITKILIANRGEIAIRVMKTAKRMGIKTVAVYSDADIADKFLLSADETVKLGGLLPRESYLDGEKIIFAAKQVGADAIHPGYGFLSENADFAQSVIDAGICFIGPSPESIRLMGDKISSKKLAQKVGVSIVPGLAESVDKFDSVLKIARIIGYPVMIKASAGGGGKGMRIVYDEKSLEESFYSCISEATKNFKDGRVFVEKYILNPRHIEVQVLGDKHGNLVCLGERECSIQRFNQKIIEEAPSQFVDSKMRKALYENAIKLSKSCGYYSAGTVEFVVDKDKSFYFLEMNTRLQVEHAVTEMVTGYDLVEEMIKIANGECLSFSQSDVKIKGSAIECRICAEDPFNNFASSSGRITDYREPKESETVRVESGCVKGMVISHYYDSMLGKLITFGDDRDDAIARMKKALGNYIISGIETNIFMLECIMRNGRFSMGDISTQFLKEEYPDGFVSMKSGKKTLKYFLVIAALINSKISNPSRVLFDETVVVPDSMNLPEPSKACVVIDGVRYITNINCMSTNNDNSCRVSISVNGKDDGSFICNYKLGSKFAMISQCSKENNSCNVLSENICEIVKIDYVSNLKVNLFMDGVDSSAFLYPVRVMHLLQYIANKPKKEKPKDKIFSQISGLVTNVNVKVGQKVRNGDVVMSIEAMKMENSIVALCNGVVKSVVKQNGDTVSSGQLLVELQV
ncbi:MAG: biotin/lipoyl-binding protein [Alphaproteobacteria bacterium]|nr:biotin/lipoyl-binding protein [Rickettsiales bacterium]